MFSLPSKLYLAACSCFFVTGMSALICEVCWIRKSALVFGSSTWAISLVLAVFFAGLALGSYVIGRFSPQSASPLRSYAWLEIGVGCVTLLSPLTFAWIDWLYGQLYSSVFASPWLLTVTRLGLVSFIMLPATVMMGGTLPLLCQQFVRQNGRVTRGIGSLYGINTLGAALGAFICGFWLIPNIGVNYAIALAGSSNLLVGLMAFLFFGVATETGRVTKAQPAIGDDELRITDSSLRQRLSASQCRVLGSVFFGIGFVAVATEVLWTRYLSLWMPNTVYTYTITLTIVLLGIVIGSGLGTFVSDHARWKAALIGLSQVLSALLVILSMQLRPGWWGDWFNAVSVTQQLTVVSAVMLVPSILSGLCFPLAIGMVATDSRQIGMQAGRMTAINLLGGIAGATATGFVMLPHAGLHYSLLIVTGIGLFLGVVSWWSLATGIPRILKLVGSFTAISFWIGIPLYLGTKLPESFLAAGAHLVDFREGVNANVSVVRNGDVRQLEINRMWQGQNIKNHQVFAAHIPALLHPAPKDVLAIGLGTGQTARSFLAHDVNRLDCVEIEDGMVDLVREHFDSKWMDDSRVNILIEDGRNYVTHTKETYDIISIEVGQIYRPRISAFYSRDFYSQLRPRLRHDGIVCQFLPIDFFGQAEFKTLVATFIDSFPHSLLWYNTSEFLLIGSREDRIRFDPEHFATVLASNPALKSELDYSYWAGPDYYLSRPESFVAGFLCGPAQLKRMSEGAEIYRDDRPYLEYLPIQSASVAPAIANTVQKHLTPFVDLISNPTIHLSVAQKIRSENLKELSARVLLRQAQMLESSGNFEFAVDAYREALKLLPNYPKANASLAKFLQSQGELETATTFFQRSLNVQPTDANILSRLSECLVRLGRYDEAESPLRQLVRLRPDSSEAQKMLGISLAAMELLDEAEIALKKTLAINPKQADALTSLANVYLSRNQDDLAQAAYASAKDLEPSSVDLRVTMGWSYGAANKNRQALQCFEEALAIDPRAPRALLGIANVYQSTGEPSKAQQAYRNLLANQPNMSEAQVGLAISLQKEGKLDEALQSFKVAIQLTPENPNVLSAAAWIMATHPDSSKRDALQAVKLAERAWKMTGEQAPQVGDVLAAAYATSGQFEKAIATSELAIQIAQKQNLPELAAIIQLRKSLYAQKQIYTQ